MMSHPHLNQLQAWKLRSSESERLECERALNILRLIAYNNRRIRAGLKPVEYPEKLVGNWTMPTNRDNFYLVNR